MTAKVFLSLDHHDAGFVREVARRLPKGLAYFYEKSFETGENLVQAMERGVADAELYVLFASQTSLESPWVNFEIDRARIAKIKDVNRRILIFPTDKAVSVSNLPAWMREFWMSRAGLNASDVARYITRVLLEPDTGLAEAATRVVGRGKSLDRLEQLVADFIQRKNTSPDVFILAGFNGIGRRTFASYYIRRSMPGDPNLAYGPIISLPAKADLLDIYRGLRNEIGVAETAEQFGRDLEAFSALAAEAKVAEILSRMKRFFDLGQAITLVSTDGFFEDRGEPKSWAGEIFSQIPKGASLFVVSNRQFKEEFISAVGNAVQLRVDELTDKDTRALMTFTAQRLRVEGFQISDELVRAIGGHADVANAAVRLAAQKGTHILERDPRQIFNVQKTILGENIEAGSLNQLEIKILMILSWVPNLRGDLLEKVLSAQGELRDLDFIDAISNLTLGCLISHASDAYAIAPSIRQLFRRWHVTSPELLSAFAFVLGGEWEHLERRGEFSADLFDAFVFIHALEGKALPKELRNLLPPATLYEVVKETYDRAKDDDNTDEIRKAISWARVADSMRMDESVREEILSVAARAHIRIGEYREAADIAASMSDRGYRSALFIRGHLLRKQEKYAEAIPVLEEATKENKYRRSAVHELALSYKKSGRLDQLRTLLQQHSNLIADSAMFADFQIGVEIARGDLDAAAAAIRRLRLMPDNDGKSDRREAQLMMKAGQYETAYDFLSELLRNASKGRFMLMSLRVVAAARSGRYDAARRDIEYIKGLPGRKASAVRLEAALLAERGEFEEAEGLLATITRRTSEDHLLQARIFELRSRDQSLGTEVKKEFERRALEIRANNNFAFEYDFGEEH